MVLYGGGLSHATAHNLQQNSHTTITTMETNPLCIARIAVNADRKGEYATAIVNYREVISLLEPEIPAFLETQQSALYEKVHCKHPSHTNFFLCSAHFINQELMS